MALSKWSMCACSDQLGEFRNQQAKQMRKITSNVGYWGPHRMHLNCMPCDLEVLQQLKLSCLWCVWLWKCLFNNVRSLWRLHAPIKRITRTIRLLLLYSIFSYHVCLYIIVPNVSLDLMSGILYFPIKRNCVWHGLQMRSLVLVLSIS